MALSVVGSFPTQAFAPARGCRGARCHRHDDSCGGCHIDLSCVKVTCPRDTSHAIIVARQAAKLSALTKLSILTKISAPPKISMCTCWQNQMQACITSSSHDAVAACKTAHIWCPRPHLVGLPEMNGTSMHHPSVCTSQMDLHQLSGSPSLLLKIAAWYTPFLSLPPDRLLPSNPPSFPGSLAH